MPTRHSPAKINLFLEVVGKRPDGYHSIESVFCQIPLLDTIAAEKSEDGDISIVCSDTTIPQDDRNLAVKAAKALQKHYNVRHGLRLRLEKTIPAGSGLGGGSSNAAHTLLLARDAWGLDAPDAELAEIARHIGADVPFFLHGGTCLCEGIGERITPLTVRLPDTVRLGLALPPIHSDTASAYRGLRLPAPGQHRPATAFIESMRRQDVDAIEREAFNRFEPTVFAALPELARLRDGLVERLNRPVRLSGSGSGLWFLLREGEDIPPEARQWAEPTGMRLLVCQP